jgi:hypothetical protein
LLLFSSVLSVHVRVARGAVLDGELEARDALVVVLQMEVSECEYVEGLEEGG